MNSAQAYAALEKIRKRQENGKSDKENDHAQADKILCDFLTAKGFPDIVAAYNRIERWYA